MQSKKVQGGSREYLRSLRVSKMFYGVQKGPKWAFGSSRGSKRSRMVNSPCPPEVVGVRVNLKIN